MVYAPAPAPTGRGYTTLATPFATGLEVVGVPIMIPPWKTVNVTVPSFTGPDGLVTVADRVTDWPPYWTGVFVAAAVVAAGLMVRAWVASVEAARPAVPL